MADVYATIDRADEATVRRLADVLELRAADPQQRAMLEGYLDELPLPPRARVLEIGCGPGPIARALAARANIAEVVAIDPSPLFIEYARTQAGELGNLTFTCGDGRELPFADGSFDAVVCHTSLCHIPSPEAVLMQARRVTGAGGLLAVFDGDYATTTVATSRHDPLQTCVEAAIDALVHDAYLIRRLPALARDAGWEPVRLRSHGYIEADDPAYMLTLIDRGCDALLLQDRLGQDGAEALKQEGRRRAASGVFFGHIA
jgi:ubiquinone/menaquinone biosynthesis C-methylase UbiE